MTLHEISPEPQIGSTRQVTLWTPTNVLWITFFLSTLAGTTLATVNWWRMGLRKKAVFHLGVAVTLLPALIGYPAVLLLLNIAAMTYLRITLMNDIAAFENHTPNVRFAHWLAGVGIGMIGILIVAAMYGCLATMVMA